MIIETSFFKLPFLLCSSKLTEISIGKLKTIMSLGNILGPEENMKKYEQTIVGTFYLAICKELEFYGVDNPYERVLISQSYPKSKGFKLSKNLDKSYTIPNWCDIKVLIQGISKSDLLNRFYKYNYTNWIEVKVGYDTINRVEIIQDLIRLSILTEKDDGKYFLFISRRPANLILSAKRKHKWVEQIFGNLGFFNDIDILQEETEKNIEYLHKSGYLRKDVKSFKISGLCYNFIPELGDYIDKKNDIYWYGYLLKIVNYNFI